MTPRCHRGYPNSRRPCQRRPLRRPGVDQEGTEYGARRWRHTVPVSDAASKRYRRLSHAAPSPARTRSVLADRVRFARDAARRAAGRERAPRRRHVVEGLDTRSAMSETRQNQEREHRASTPTFHPTATAAAMYARIGRQRAGFLRRAISLRLREALASRRRCDRSGS